MTTNFNLSPQLANIVKQKIASGRYASANEVVGEALRLLDERDHRQIASAVLAAYRDSNDVGLCQQRFHAQSRSKLLHLGLAAVHHIPYSRDCDRSLGNVCC